MSISEREQVNRFGLLEQDGLVTGFVLCVDHEPGQVRRKLERSSVFGLPAEVRTNGKPAAERLQFIYLLKDPVRPKDDRPMLLRHVAADLTGLAFIVWSSPTFSGNEIVETNDTVIDLEEDALASISTAPSCASTRNVGTPKPVCAKTSNGTMISTRMVSSSCRSRSFATRTSASTTSSPGLATRRTIGKRAIACRVNRRSQRTLVSVSAKSETPKRNYGQRG